jgi:VWFA-related protein
MPRITPRLLLPLAGIILTIAASAQQVVIFRGKVTLEDGSPPGHLVTVQRVCAGVDTGVREGAASGKTGEYVVRLTVNDFGEVFSGENTGNVVPCVLEAVDSGFVSSQIDLTDRKAMSGPRLPTIILTPKSRSTVLRPERGASVPRAASRNWDLAIKQLTARHWAEAEAPLRSVVETAPKFAPGWAALGTDCANLGKVEDARQALERAVALEPKSLGPYLPLAHAQIDLKDWKGAESTSKALIAADTKHVYVEAHMVRAVALYQMRDLDNARSEIDEAMRLDKLRELPRAEYVLGVILEAKGEYAAAGQHMRTYLEQHPHAKDADTVRERLANLGKGPVADLSAELSTVDLRMAVSGEAPVPGGLKAFATIAQMKGVPSPHDFFLEYCRAMSEGGPMGVNATKEAGDEVRAFIVAVRALENLGERRDDGTLVRLAMGTDEQIHKSRAIMAELGWKLVSKGGGYALEPGDLPNDGFRQPVLSSLGVDELALRKAIQEKREFTFEIPRENARLIGGPAWGVLLKGVPDMPSGPAEVFTKDWRFARVYSGLGGLEGDTAAAVVSGVGLENLIQKYSLLMADYGDALAVTDKHVAVPGGLKAQPVWAKLAGANPQTPAPFLRALFEKDQGRLLAFYFDLAHADAAHQQYFTRTPERAEAFYKWYRDSAPPSGVARTPDRWQARILQTLRIDAAGKVIFPGGREVWAEGSQSDDEILLHHAPLETLAAVSSLEGKRGAPVSTAAAQLLELHYSQWRNLFPYFEQLKGLEAEEFGALADFAEDAQKAPAARRHLLMGEWHSLVKLIVLGTEAGSLTSGQAAQAFRQACDAMRSANPSVEAIATVRTMAGGAADLDDAVASGLLRLDGARRQAFENVKKLQNVPQMGTLGAEPEGAQTLAALSGTVYAALLDPADLLVAEDPGLVRRHNFVPSGNPPPPMFAHATLAVSSGPKGTNFLGGFGEFQEAARPLDRRKEGEPQPRVNGSETGAQQEAEHDGAGTPDPPAPPAGDLVFRAGGRIVEAYTTVTDGRGHYVDNLSKDRFSVLEEGQPKPVFAFEDHAASVSVALVFDTTGSMVAALPSVKVAAMQLVDDLRANDSVAVYSFNDTVSELQGFTSDKDAAKRAILKTHAAGITALYDALVRVNHDLALRGGKKVIVVFTDGSDNASMLPSDVAIARARARGVPIYTIAEGEALIHPELLEQLSNLSKSTGGSAFLIRKLSDISTVFEKVSQDLLHGYLVAFQPSPGDNHAWRRIEVVLDGDKGLHVRAREGFFVE